MKNKRLKKIFLLVLGFGLLIALPFTIIKTPSTSDQPLNPYPEPKDPAASYIHKASDNFFYREFKKADENYHKAIAIYEERKDFVNVASTFESLGDLYKFIHDLEQAQKNYLKARDQYVRINNKPGEARSLKEIGDLHVRHKKLDSADEWYKKALLVLKNEKPHIILGAVHESMGHLYKDSGKIPEAIESFTQAQEAFAAVKYQLGYDGMTSMVARLKKRPPPKTAYP